MRVLSAPVAAGLPDMTTALAAGALAGLLAAVVMNWPMSRQPEGFTPAYIATGVLARTPHENVRFRDAMIVHHLAGGLAGVLYAVALTVVDRVVPAVITVGGLNLLAHVLSASIVVAFIYGFFAHFVLPRAGGQSYEEEATAVRGQWLRSALVFGVTLVVVVPLVVVSVG